MKQTLLSTGRKQLASLFNFTYRYIDDFLSIYNPEFENYLGQIYPVELKSKTRQRASLLCLTWIYFCRSGVNCILPFMTNMKISISISQMFRSWVAILIYQLRPPIASLSQRVYDTSGLAPRMNVLFWGRHDFQISFWDRDTSRNAWNRHWIRCMADTGILSNNIKFLYHEC